MINDMYTVQVRITVSPSLCLCVQTKAWFDSLWHIVVCKCDLHTCFACSIPLVARHFHSRSYALDCTLWLRRIRHKYLSWPTCIRKYSPPSNTRQKSSRRSGRHFGGMWGCRLLFLTHKKHTGNFYRSTVVRKQAHSLPVCLARFLKQHTQAHMMIKRSEGLRATLGLGTAVNHSYDVVHAFYSDLSERFGNCAQWWVSRTRQGHSRLPGLSSLSVLLLLGHLGSAACLPPSLLRAKQWQVRCPENSLHTAGLWHTAGVNEAKTELSRGADSLETPVLLHKVARSPQKPTFIQQHKRYMLTFVEKSLNMLKSVLIFNIKLFQINVFWFKIYHTLSFTEAFTGKTKWHISNQSKAQPYILDRFLPE